MIIGELKQMLMELRDEGIRSVHVVMNGLGQVVEFNAVMPPKMPEPRSRPKPQTDDAQEPKKPLPAGLGHFGS